MIARVAIDLALDRLFDYEVPEALEGKLAVGQLLSVPFGHREARGFVMELGGDDKILVVPDDVRYANIKDIDDVPAFQIGRAHV